MFSKRKKLACKKNSDGGRIKKTRLVDVFLFSSPKKQTWPREQDLLPVSKSYKVNTSHKTPQLSARQDCRRERITYLYRSALIKGRVTRDLNQGQVASERVSDLTLRKSKQTSVEIVADKSARM
ncbi:hypothetical protein ElyMa_005490700 [Elysia marginata]|uniref:Uncharacterized protein n=1 Tax=Elysia marginata TaxID=1093978 RepID=A0AAV4ESJ8_9GAST|nr:hypothetical protein ElyMa_005490700 [Elysia marginata]